MAMNMNNKGHAANADSSHSQSLPWHHECLVEPHPHQIGSPHDSPGYQDYLHAALAPDVHKMPPAVLHIHHSPGGHHSPRLSGHQHPREHAINPKNTVEAIMIPSHATLPIIHIHLRSVPLNTVTPVLHDAPSFDIRRGAPVAGYRGQGTHTGQSWQWQQHEDDQDCGSDMKTIRNHGSGNNKGNQDDHGGDDNDNDMKTIMAAATMAKTIKTAMVV
ncbi:hypothetical protein EDB83DRAFT_2315988 [Lactarius deliciosus]|nr:hypothetical protein EDB83DRAFT_2315988 [Lactarius deliciosus]